MRHEPIMTRRGSAAILLLALSGCTVAEPGATGTAGAPAAALEPVVIDALRQMGATLMAARSFGVRIHVQRNGVLPDGQQVTLLSTTALAMQRPDRLVALVGSDRGNFRLSYDGRTVSLVDLTSNSYGQGAFSGSVEALLAALERQFDIDLPVRDLLAPDPYAALVEPGTTGVMVGQTVVGGVICDHFALRSGETDWEIWLEADGRRLPRMLATVDRSLAERPRVVLTFEDWTLEPRLPPGVFSTRRPPGATDIVLPTESTGAAR